MLIIQFFSIEQGDCDEPRFHPSHLQKVHEIWLQIEHRQQASWPRMVNKITYDNLH
jgi:hypothetical protein